MTRKFWSTGRRLLRTGTSWNGVHGDTSSQATVTLPAVLRGLKRVQVAERVSNGMTDARSEFGEKLKWERERRGVSLAKMCAETKVNPRHFEALEAGNYTALPGGVFRRGIVRAYLRGTELEETHWMSLFQASYERYLADKGGATDEPENAWVAFALNVKRGRGGVQNRTRLRWLGVAVLLLGVVVGAWFLYRSLALQTARP
jgi:cytoskeleton protein RodZ